MKTSRSVDNTFRIHKRRYTDEASCLSGKDGESKCECMFALE